MVHPSLSLSPCLPVRPVVKRSLFFCLSFCLIAFVFLINKKFLAEILAGVHHKCRILFAAEIVEKKEANGKRRLAAGQRREV
jgi:hypothetical protein